VIAGGIWLRLDQLSAQLLLDDEWHAVYRVVHDMPVAVFLDFGFADSSIPLTLLYLAEANAFGLTELGMRVPLVAAGIATLVLFPWYVARHVGRSEALLFAALLAISPLLFFFSRQARPYALTLLLVWAAHVAFRRYTETTRGRAAELTLYAASAAFASWLHPVVVPFVVAPFFSAMWRSSCNPAADARKAQLLRLAAAALAAGIPMIALLLPPLVAHPESVSVRSGIDLPRGDTLIGVWYHWFGTGSTIAVIVCGTLALIGGPIAWRRLPEARSMLLGALLCVLLIIVTRPEWVGNSITLARYLLPMLPLLLLATACGAVNLARTLSTIVATHGARVFWARAAGSAAAVLPLVALAATSPLPPVLTHPNASGLHGLYLFDFRPAHNPIRALMDGIPLSPWWASLANRPQESIAMAVAPLPVETVGWDAPRWQRLSRQRVLSGFLTPLCPSSRRNEVPDDRRFRFRNAVHLGDDGELATHGVDFIVWQKPYRYVAHGYDLAIADDVAGCGAVLRAHFGAPTYEDQWLAVYRRTTEGAK
jgi:hypothetical protein